MDELQKKYEFLIAAPMLQSGAGRVITDLALGLSAEGHKVAVVSSGSKGAYPDWEQYVEALEKDGIAYHVVDLFHRDEKAMEEATEEMIRLIRSNDFDLINAHAGVPAAIAKKAMETVGVSAPLIAVFHSWNPERPSWMDRDDLNAFSRCDRIVCDSHYYRNFLVKKGLRKEAIEVIHPGLKRREIDPVNKKSRRIARDALGIAGDQFVAVELGVIEPRKGQLDFIKALAKFKRRSHRENLKGYLVGAFKDDDYLAQIKEKIVNIGMLNHIEIVGYAENPKTFLHAADLFILPTYSEGLGIVILEAMACGIPVICSAVEGTLDIAVHGKNALTFKPSCVDEITEAIMQLTGNKEKTTAIARQGLNTVREKFLWEVTLEKYTKLFTRMILESRVSEKSDKNCGN